MSKLINNKVFISGMFRSGTTLVARMLASHSEVACASDPFLPLYKHIRNKIIGRDIKDESPLQDYYFDSNSIETYKVLKNIRIAEINVSSNDLEYIKHKIKEYTKPFSPRIAESVDKLKGSTVDNIVECGMNLVGEVYGGEDSSLIATKEVWANEFGSILIQNGLVNKVIHIVRDPRAVIASNIASGQVYPLIFTLRQWRKLAGIAIMNQDNKNHKIIRYEDIMNDKKKASEEICKYIGVDFDVNMVREETYRDGDGQPWKRNTSYRNKKMTKITGTDDWKNVLSLVQKQYIEKYAGREMSIFGYKKELECYPSTIGYDEKDIRYANWINKYADYNWIFEEQKEKKRLEYMSATNLNSEEIDLNFIDKEIYERVKN